MDAIEVDLTGAHVRFTGRDGGVSAGPFATLNLGPWTGDDLRAVAENRRTATDGRDAAWCRQVHRTTVHAVTAATDGEPLDGDGLATTTPTLAVIALTADCLPVALAAPSAVAMVHAGWRGLVDGVLEAGVRAVRALAPGERIEAAIGPGAGGCCYEVGEEVSARLPATVRDGRRVDLKAAAAARLRAAGVARVEDVERCTICEADRFFSHRVSGPVTGRQAGIAWRA